MNKTLTVEEYKRALGKGFLHTMENVRFGLESKDIPSAPVARKKPQHIEDDHTKLVASYLEILLMEGKIIEYTHTANETYTKSWKQKARNKAMGVRSGIPDMVIVYPHDILFLELKRPVGGVVSASQKMWIAALEAVGGPVHCKVARGYDEAREIIDSFIS